MKNLIKTLITAMPEQTTVSLQQVGIHSSQARMTFSCLNGKLESVAKLTFCLTDTAQNHAVLFHLSVAVKTPELPLLAQMPKTKLQFLALLRAFTPEQLNFSYSGHLLYADHLVDIDYPETTNIEPKYTEGKTATVIALQQAMGDFAMDDRCYENADLILIEATDLINNNSVADASQIRQMVHDAWMDQCQN